MPPQILDQFARENKNLKAIHVVRGLPRGWLGKSYAMVTAYQHAAGDWLVSRTRTFGSRRICCGALSD
jgi:hypothetical protein